MSHMTRLPGVPDTDDVFPGMASFAGTGPAGKTCESCAQRGYWRARKSKFNPRTGLIEERGYQSSSCRMFLTLTHSHGPAVDKNWRACKYYEANPRRMQKPTTEVNTMPKVSELFPAQFLKGSDLAAPRDVTLGAWRTENKYGRDEHIFDLAGETLALRCGPQLMREIAAALNEDDFDRWLGRSITVYGKGQPIKDKDTGQQKDVVVTHAMASKLDRPPGNGNALSIRNSDMDDDIPY